MSATPVLIALALLLPAVPIWALTAPNPADYPEIVHVSSSELVPSGGAVPSDRLEVLIGGKKYILEGPARLAETHTLVSGIHPGVLPAGDYRAKRITHPNYKPDTLIFLSFDLLTPDGKTSIFEVIGQSE